MSKSLHIKKGDTVLVLSGADKGAKGKVLYTLPEKNRAAVERVKLVKKHQKPSMKHPTGGIIEQEAAINASNLMLVCPKCSEAMRAKSQKLEDGKTMRRCPKCSEIFD